MDSEPSVERWHIGLPPEELGATDGLIAFTERELAIARTGPARALGFHEAARGSLPRSPEVRIALPTYRGKRLVPLLAWMAVERLVAPGGLIVWSMGKQQGPDSVRGILEGLGWDLEKERAGRLVRLSGKAPVSAAPPAPRDFTADLGARRGVRLAADYGVFSPERIDEGTALLLDVALAEPPASRVADIGVGYGALAIGLVLNGLAASAVGTDVDAIALWLTEHNARINSVPMELVLTANPLDAGPAPLSVANVPTHIDAAATGSFMASLAERAFHGRVLLVVHATLEQRYVRYLASGGPVQRYPGRAHVVLGIGASSRASTRREYHASSGAKLHRKGGPVLNE